MPSFDPTRGLTAGFVERGQFDVRFTETDVEGAIWRFVEWIVPAQRRAYVDERHRGVAPTA